MKSITDDLYESFKKNLESVNGNCMRTPKAELGKVITELFKEHNVDSISAVRLGPVMKPTKLGIFFIPLKISNISS